MSDREQPLQTFGDIGLDEQGWDEVARLAESLVEDGTLPAVAVQLGRRGQGLGPRVVCGRQHLEDEVGTLSEDAIFLVASITKPIVALATMLLVERGELALNDRVVDLLPEFDAAPRRQMTVRHLLTHTSGLPDMLPNNRQLRESNSPASAFFEGTCAVTLDFPPGHGVQYQSMGFVLLAEIIQRCSGRSCGDFVREEIFAPLGMNDSALGAPDGWLDKTADRRERIVEVRVPQEQQGGDSWNWNSPYWQQVGAPWGGMLSSASDVAIFCLAMLERGGPFSPATQSAAMSNQLSHFPDVPEADRRCRPWGLGWRLNWPTHSANFGDLLGPSVAGHWGATGTLCWIDRVTGIVCVILSTQPLDRGRNHLVRLSNAVVAAFR